eukprot:4721415-Pleurochrysis_carterae.AAC.1
MQACKRVSCVRAPMQKCVRACVPASSQACGRAYMRAFAHAPLQSLYACVCLRMRAYVLACERVNSDL